MIYIGEVFASVSFQGDAFQIIEIDIPNRKAKGMWLNGMIATYSGSHWHDFSVLYSYRTGELEVSYPITTHPDAMIVCLDCGQFCQQRCAEKRL